MKKVLTAVLSVTYLFIFVLCVQSLGATREFGSILVVPALIMFFLHLISLFNKNFSYFFWVFIAVCDIALFALPLLFFGSLMTVEMIALQIIPLICSVLLCIFVTLEKKKVQ